MERQPARRWNSPAAERTRLPSAARSARFGWGTLQVDAANTLQIVGSSATAAVTNNAGTIQQQSGSTSLGVVSGTGNLDVGNGSQAAELTANQIVQNTLTIGAGSTVTIIPSASGSGNVSAAVSTAASSVSTASSAGVASSADAGSAGDPFLAIQSAVNSGSVSAAAGQRLDNRLLAIARLSQSDPSFGAGAVEDSLLAIIPGWSVSSSGADPSPAELISLAESDGLLPNSVSTSEAVPSSNLILPTGTTVGATATVPEPSTLVLTGLAVASAALAVRKRKRLWAS